MEFANCPKCKGTGAVQVYRAKMLKAIRDGKEWTYARSSVVCACSAASRLGQRLKENWGTYDPDQYCIDESAGWEWHGRERRLADHEAVVKEWLLSKGTELVGEFSFEEWGSNHGG